MRVLFFIVILLLVGCNSDSNDTSSLVTQDDIVKSYAIDRLINETYYFPAKNQSNSLPTYQPLERFDLIFVGHDFNSNASLLAHAIPGHYTHILTYLGKDSQGFAYAAEINSDESQNFSIGIDGLKVDGHLYIYCLGNDFGDNVCPKDAYIHGMETYDYMWAKRLKPELRELLIEHENRLITTIKEDLKTAYPFQLAFHIGPETPFTKVIPLIDDGRQKGTDCTAYFISLFEEVAEVCLDEIRIDAAALELYYLYDPIGQKAKLPAQYNPFSMEDIYLSELFSELGYSLIDNIPRQTSCPDSRMVTGIPIPDLIFDSPSMVGIQPVHRSIKSN